MIPKLLIIAGPTASGKKRLAFDAAERFDGEIISADSRKVYRYLDIATAKPSHSDRERVPHHLIDIVDPDEPFNAAEWVKRSAVAVKDIIARGRLPIISGGTGFYISAFLDGLSDGMAADPELRDRLDAELADSNAESMHQKLAAIDPVRAGELHVNDTFRVLRALEVCYSTGSTYREAGKSGKTTGGDYDYLSIGISMPRDVLYERVNTRVDDMIARGLLDELKNVLAMGYSRGLMSLDTVGCKEWFGWLDGDESYESCLENMKRNTRRYAKRQLTWFRSRDDVRWIDILDESEKGKLWKDIGSWLERPR